MKKLMVLALVLGVVGLANAGLKITGYDGSDLKAGDSVVLSIVAENLTAAEYAYFAMVADPALGSISGGVKGVGSITELFGGAYLDYFPAAGLAGIDGYIGDSTGATLNGVVVAQINLLVNGDKSFKVDLLASPDFATFGTGDSLMVNVIPEPMTMGLLALGGLFIRRKK